MICSTLLIQKLIIINVDEIGIDILLDKCAEVRHSFLSNPICTVNSPFNGVLPTQIISSLREVLAEVLIEERSDLFGLCDKFFVLYIGKVHYIF